MLRSQRRRQAPAQAGSSCISLDLQKLIDGLAGFATPRKTVGRPANRFQSRPVVATARGIPGHQNLVTYLERVTIDALIHKFCGTAPFQRPTLNYAVRVGRFDLNKRMRVTQGDLDDLSFKGNVLLIVVGSDDGMMCEQSHTKE